jgi:tyrosine-specific transport protein
MVIAEVAIKQHESSGEDVAASFKDFADANLDNPSAASVVAGISIFTNGCILVFGLDRAGEVASTMLGGSVGPTESMLAFAGVLAAMGFTQSGENMTKICSALVIGLFASFCGLLVPGLINVHDPLGTLFSTGTCDCGISEAAPIILMSMVYQNIVPTVTKILDYDRFKSVTAIALGSLLPLCLYLAWCFACIGGGVDANAVGAEGVLMAVFSITAISGSSIGCAMSLAEEVGSFLPKTDRGRMTNDLADPISVAAAVAIPAAIAFLCAGGDDFNAALKVAGSYGSPLLYGAIPAGMAWTQRQRVKGIQDLVPGGSATLAGLGVASIALVMQELAIDASTLLA